MSDANNMESIIDDLLEDLPEEAVSPIDDFEEEINEIVEEKEEEDIGEKSNPVYQTKSIIGKDLDQDSANVFILVILIWVLIWFTSGLWKTLEYDPIFVFIFLFFIVYICAQIYTSGTSSGGVVYELNILLTVEQMISILFGTIVVFTLFSHYLRDKMGVHPNCMNIIFKLSISIVIILTTASLWVNVITSGRSFRAIRKFKQGIYNVSLTLFIIIGLIVYKGVVCPPAKTN